ncbi:hypothetical protein FX988_03701 [Paraglaciecola mesophila]|uniref:Polysaccharide biosynthesis protein C-terminal domain-containing protein n=2 Tax=Paraglaciecola mesophila TaxID=197222 RepID=A0A857JQK7_9ALTE|nr:hypothetical protein FX988_03701 [Paraglaciecola mesophila]
MHAVLLSNSAITFFFKLVSSVISFFLLALITKSLGAELSGYYFLFIATLLFLNSISSLGMNNILVKLIAVNLDYSKQSSIFFVLLKYILISSFLVSVVLILYKLILGFSFFSGGRISEYLVLLAIVLPAYSLKLLFSSYYQAKNRVFLSMFSFGLGYQCLLFLLLVVLEPTSVRDVLLLFVLSVYIILIFIFFIFLRDSHLVKVNQGFRETFTMSFPLLVSQVVSQMSIFVVQFILAEYSSPTDLSYFSVCQRISILLSFLVIAINRVISPMFAKVCDKKSTEELQSLIIFSNRLLFMFSFPLFTLIIVFGENILELFGPQFIDAYPTLLVILSAQFLASLIGTMNFLLQMSGHQKQFSLSVIYCSLFSFLLAIILIPNFGLSGAALTTFVSLTSVSLVSCFVVLRKLKVNPFKIY